MADAAFCVEARLACPLAYSPAGVHAVSLDSLLLYAVLKEAGRLGTPVWREQLRVDASGVELPLARVTVGGREVYAGSVGFPVGPVKWQPFGWVRRADRGWGAGGCGSGIFRDRMERFFVLAAGKVRFYGRGDPERVLGLLERNIFALGHKRNRGFGRVAGWSVRPVSSGSAGIWLETRSAVYPARPLPLEAVSERPDAVGVVMRGCLEPPHWLREEREELLFPPPFLWQEGLAEGDPDFPEPNPWPGFGTGSAWTAFDVECGA